MLSHTSLCIYEIKWYILLSHSVFLNFYQPPTTTFSNFTTVFPSRYVCVPGVSRREWQPMGSKAIHHLLGLVFEMGKSTPNGATEDFWLVLNMFELYKGDLDLIQRHHGWMDATKLKVYWDDTPFQNYLSGQVVSVRVIIEMCIQHTKNIYIYMIIYIHICIDIFIY